MIDEILGKIPMGFGGAAISGEGGGYGFGTVSEADAEKLLLTAWDMGIRLFDTAPIYGFGLSEQRMGKYLPQDAYIVTKGGVDWHPNMRVNMSNAPQIIEKMIEESLKRLNRPISMYMIHWPDLKVDIRESLSVVKKYQDRGDIKDIGLCNTHKEDLQRAEEICTIKGLQSEVNLFNHENLNFIEKKYLTMSWGSLDKGILSDRVKAERKFESHDARAWAPWWNKKEVEQKIQRVEKLKKILVDHHIALTHFALQFIVNYKGIDFALIGSKTIDDLKQSIKLVNSSLDKDVLEKIYLEWTQG